LLKVVVACVPIPFSAHRANITIIHPLLEPSFIYSGQVSSGETLKSFPLYHNTYKERVLGDQKCSFKEEKFEEEKLKKSLVAKAIKHTTITNIMLLKSNRYYYFLSISS
jgi:hypothetical protein